MSVRGSPEGPADRCGLPEAPFVWTFTLERSQQWYALRCSATPSCSLTQAFKTHTRRKCTACWASAAALAGSPGRRRTARMSERAAAWGSSRGTLFTVPPPQGGPPSQMDDLHSSPCKQPLSFSLLSRRMSNYTCGEQRRRALWLSGSPPMASISPPPTHSSTSPSTRSEPTV